MTGQSVPWDGRALIHDCPACGSDHAVHLYRVVGKDRLEDPVMIEGTAYRYWAICPETDQTVLVKTEGERLLTLPCVIIHLA